MAEDLLSTSIDAFRGFGLRLHPPISDRELAVLAENLGAPLPGAIVDLYRAFGGIPESTRLPMAYGMRLLSPEEVVSDRACLADQAESLSPAADARYFFSDDNSNWAGCFVTGPLVGKVCFLDHDEPNDVPRYRSIERLFEETVRACQTKASWFEMPTDYPSPAELSSDLFEDDVALVRVLRRELAHAGPEERVRLALHIVQLTPSHNVAELIEFLNWPSLWVQSEAVRMMGHRDHAPAVDRLESIARADEASTPVIAALVALGKMTDPRARASLDALQDSIDPGYSIYFP